MGHGDDIMATGMAKGAKDRGKRIAFGDGQKIIWGPWSAEIFKHNPNVAPPGHERASDIEWIRYHKGHRIYNKQGQGRWIWNYDFRPIPGEFHFHPSELPFFNLRHPNLVVMEPNTPNKPCGPNKQWPVERFKMVADELKAAGFDVVQFEYGGKNVVTKQIRTGSFRQAAILLKEARLAILPEGGLHHAAAALVIPAVVLFGAWVPPKVLGYDMHINLADDNPGCGLFIRCQHCVDAMNKIKVNDVLDAAERYLS